MERIERTFAATKDWAPLPWDVYKIVPLFDSSGEVLAYAEKSYEREAIDIPTEIFNHQLAEVDPHDPEQFASFMSCYGLLGEPKQRDLRAQAIMDVKTTADAKTADRRYLFSVPSATPKERLAWYQAMREASRAAELGWKESAESLNDLSQGHMFVTAQDAVDTYNQLMSSASVAKALAFYEGIEDIAKYLNMQEEDTLDHVVSCTDYLNKLLRALSPQMDVIHYRADGTLSEYPPIDEFHERPKREGSLAEAIALQIYKFSMYEGDYKECEECGTIFAICQNEKRKGTPRSSSTFCGKKCRNLNAQHRRRKILKEQAKAKRALLLARSKDNANRTTS